MTPTVEVEQVDGSLVVVPVEQGIATYNEYVELTPLGARWLTDAPMPLDTYGELCALVGREKEALRWFIGDLLAYGERVYGETYAQYVEFFGCSYWTLQAYRRVSAAIPLEERDPAVPWTAYQITAHLEPDDRRELVDAYQSGEIEDTGELRDEVKKFREGEPEAQLLPPCPKCGGRLTSRKCKGCGMDFPAAVWWIKEMLGGMNLE